MRAAVIGGKQDERIVRNTVGGVAIAVRIVQSRDQATERVVHTSNKPSEFRFLFLCDIQSLERRSFQIWTCFDRPMHGIGMQLQIEGLALRIEFANRFFHRIRQRIADVLRLSDLSGGNVKLLDISFRVRLREAIEVPSPETGKVPLIFHFFSETHRLMALVIAADIDIKTLILGQRRFAIVTADMILADVRGGIAVLLQCLGNGDRLGCHILTLLRAFELSLRFSDARRLVTVQVADDIDIVIYPRRILPREDRRATGRTVGLHVGLVKTQALVSQLFEMRGLKHAGMGLHRPLPRRGLVPAQIVDHVNHDVGASGCVPVVGGDHIRPHDCECQHGEAL